MPEIMMRLLGAPQVELDGQALEIERQKALALLIYLHVQGGIQSRDTLATLFWGENDQSTARASLRRDLSVLNKALNKRGLLIERESVGLSEIFVDSDVKQFRQIIARCITSTDKTCLQKLEEAIVLYQGDFLNGFSLKGSPEFDEWQRYETENLRQNLLTALRHLVDIYQSKQHYSKALIYALQWLSIDTWDDVAHATVMQLYALDGQQMAVKRQYDAYVDIRQKQLGLEPSAEIKALYYQLISQERTPDLPNFTSIEVPHNLPEEKSEFINRSTVLTEITQRMVDPTCRLQTLVGAGGTGKTRLALKTTRTILDDVSLNHYFKDGIYFVSLLSVTIPHQLYRVIMDELSLTVYEHIPVREQLLTALRDKHCLLVLDNFEHLIDRDDTSDSGADIVGDLLIQSHNLKFLITSRQALNLHEEWIYPVHGMVCPPPDSEHSHENIAELLHYNAVELFVRVAQRITPSFSYEENAAHLVKICHLVEGVPLAIELAAIHTRTKSCADIASDLEESINILASPMRNVPSRHRSMRTVFEKSWQALDKQEQLVLLKTAIFENGFSEQAMHGVTGFQLEDINPLIEKSLIQIEHHSRYRIHNLLRQFILEKLDQSPQIKHEAQTSHSRYYLAFLRENSPDHDYRRQATSMRILNQEIGNIRKAWQQAVRSGDTVIISQAHQGFYELLSISSRFREGEQRFRETATALEAMNAETSMIQKLRIYQGIFSAVLGKYQIAYELLLESVSSLTILRDDNDLVFSLDWLGKVTDIQGGTQEAELLYQQSLQISMSIQDKHGIASSLYNLGWIAMRKGDYKQAQEQFEHSHRIYNEIEHVSGIAHALDGAGMSAFFAGQYATAETYFLASYDKFSSIGDRHGIARALAGQGLVALGIGGSNLITANELLQQSLEINRAISGQVEVVRRLTFLGITANQQVAYKLATEYLQEALTLSRDIGFSFGVPWALAGLGWSMIGKGDLQRARAYLHEALEIAFDDNEIPIVLDTMVSVAMYAIAHPKIESEADAALLLSTVLDHAAAWQISKDRAQELMYCLSATGDQISTLETIRLEVLPRILAYSKVDKD